jgi:hypothetical protein
LNRDKLDQVCRELIVRNAAGERLTVCVQYFTKVSQTVNGQTIRWRQWYPGDPELARAKPIESVLEPNEITNLFDGDWPIRASRARLWAKSDKREWPDYKDLDLELNVDPKTGTFNLANPNKPYIYDFP